MKSTRLAQSTWWIGCCFVWCSVWLVSCGEPPAGTAPTSVWKAAYNLQLGSSLSQSRLAPYSCFQVQREDPSGGERLVISRKKCADTLETIPDSLVALSLTVRTESGTMAFIKENIAVGLGAVEGDGDTRRVRLEHLCQFAEPGATKRLPFPSLCEVVFEGTGAIRDIRIFSVEEIIHLQAEELETQASLAARLEQERRELLEKVRRLQETITHLQYQAETEDFLSETEQRMDALRTELRLNPDATPEAIGAAVQKQGVLISQFAREITELKKALDLPKTAGFEEVLKALRAIKKQSQQDSDDPAAPLDPKQPAKSPIND